MLSSRNFFGMRLRCAAAGVAWDEWRADGWVRTGDAGYFDGDGYLFIYDRLKDMICSGGENVHAAEVKAVLCEHPAIAEVAVIGVPAAKWGEVVKAIVVPAGDAAIVPGEIMDWARGRLAGFKLPETVDIAAALPRNPSGKILKQKLRRPFWEGRDRNVN